ncbi:MAG: cytochrome c oxidase assembly protein [Gammaproteobacteria bacterium]|nr:cytochrome c oxidase assembly protein [Gammaproteobacteria bacterium]NVK89247.1 cytochrome c oxidase assembly protein [Gammaproteobacteria bacterium]
MKQANKKMVFKTLGIVGLMTAFTFAMVPLYNVFCEITGINGKVLVSKELYEKVEVDKSRVVTVELITSIHRGMPWKFETTKHKIDVHPGELNEVMFYAKNLSGKTITGQAVPSVAPSQASFYVSKTECFCFDQQTLLAGEEINMPMKFYIDPDLPKSVHTVTMSYQLFNATSDESAAAAGQ